MKIFKKPFMIFLFIGLISIFTGCTVGLNSYSAKAVNIKAAGTSYSSGTTKTLVGSVVYLYAYNTSTGTYSTTNYSYTTVDSDGTFRFDSLATGKYKLTGSQRGWTFVPRYVEFSDSYSDMPDLLAYPADDGSQYTIVATWAERSINVDMQLTYGKDPETSTTYAWTSTDTVASAGERLRIYEDAVGSTSGFMLNRTVDPTSTSSYPLVETISIYSNSWLANGDTILIYLDAPASAALLTGDYVSSTSYPAAFAQIDLMMGSTHYGTWYTPYNTSEDTFKMLELTYDSTSLALSSANSTSDIKSVIWE